MGQGSSVPPEAPKDEKPPESIPQEPSLLAAPQPGFRSAAEANPEEEVYVGDFDEAGMRNGEGTLLYPLSDSGGRARYRGTFLRGKRHGIGSILWRNGSSYVGGWENDMLSGRGTFTWATGMKYEGEWIENFAHGLGELIFPTGKKYRGQWYTGKRHGIGVLEYGPNDARQRLSYNGEWVDDQQSGNGIMTWTNNAVYQGEWRDGKRHGYGVHRFANGEYYEGYWMNGVRQGHGRRVEKDGSFYEGGWVNDKKHGDGIYGEPHGRITYERWALGKRVTDPPVPQTPQSLLVLCVEAIAQDTWRFGCVDQLPADLSERIKKSRQRQCKWTSFFRQPGNQAESCDAPEVDLQSECKHILMARASQRRRRGRIARRQQEGATGVVEPGIASLMAVRRWYQIAGSGRASLKIAATEKEDSLAMPRVLLY